MSGKIVEICSERRKFLTNTARILCIYKLYQLSFLSEAWGKPIKSIINTWIRDIYDICRSVQSGKLSPSDWQIAINKLHTNIPLEDVLQFLDLDKILKSTKYPSDKLGAVQNIDWPEVEGFPKPNFGHKLFIYRKGSCTPSHAHNHLVSSHFIIKGQMRVRTFDRIEDLENSLLIKETRNDIPPIGTAVSMSDYRDNIHWFEGVSDISVSFDIPVGRIEPKKEYRHAAEGNNSIFINASGTANGKGIIEAPIIPFANARRLYAL